MEKTKRQQVIDIYTNNEDPAINFSDIARAVECSREFVRQVVMSLYKTKEEYEKDKQNKKQLKKKIQLENKSENITADIKLRNSGNILLVGEDRYYRIIYRGCITNKFYNKKLGQYARILKGGLTAQIIIAKEFIDIKYQDLNNTISTEKLNRISLTNNCYCIEPILRPTRRANNEIRRQLQNIT